MYYFLQIIFDSIFPPHEEALIVRELAESDMRGMYMLQSVNDIRALSRYTDTRIRALIHEAKFHGNTKAFSLLSVLVRTYLEKSSVQIDIVVPIPLSRARMRARGYNQVFEVLRATQSHIPNMVIATDILMRTRDTRPQTELPRNERLVNVSDAFGVTHEDKITGKHILVIDDVSTTGATLLAAKAALQGYAPASITCVALAH